MVVCRVTMNPQGVSEEAAKEPQAAVSKGSALAHHSDQDTLRTVNGKLVNETEYEAMMTMLGHNVVFQEVNWVKQIENVPNILQGKPSRNMPLREFHSMESTRNYISRQTKWPSAVGALADSAQQFNRNFNKRVADFNTTFKNLSIVFRNLSIALSFSAVLTSISFFISVLFQFARL